MDRNQNLQVASTLQVPTQVAPARFAKAEGSEGQIDHIYLPDAAWNRGAGIWALSKRIRFANDVNLNLLTVDGSSNESKGARTLGEWMPIDKSIPLRLSRPLFERRKVLWSADQRSGPDSIAFTAETCL